MECYFNQPIQLPSERSETSWKTLQLTLYVHKCDQLDMKLQFVTHSKTVGDSNIWITLLKALEIV